MPALTDLDLHDISQRFAAWGHSPAHARRLVRAFYDGSGHADLQQLELGRKLVARLGAEMPLRQSQILRRHASADGTIKLLIAFTGGGAVESVLMPAYRTDRAAACVSSQIGCAMGCDFCASTRGGLSRHLTAGEIVEQFLHLRQLAAASGRRLTSLVFMGMGEPLANLPNVITAIRRIADPAMGALGWRQITVSTVGLVPQIDALAEADLNVHLALSLHAPDDATRSRLVPSNRRWNVAAVMAAARRFAQKTGRIPTIEYCLLDAINDSDAQAAALAELMDGFKAHVNLIPHNWIGAGISGTEYHPPPPRRIDAFIAVLRQGGVVAHIRRQRGDDVAAACGQLAAADSV
ncbi:MAG TPA: 23S rRNA (adenine(2503)-C(2))-methyltransferase RlmN [Tepidisphaeraceae bacterium]|nr:23S rRNA (adenine(2503)-C(2))-methyltransferase RlmN [Tepidisphaeraceae bacterium]